MRRWLLVKCFLHYRSTDRKHVIHTVGPIYSSGQAANCERLLESSYKVSLQLAVANDCETIVSMPILNSEIMKLIDEIQAFPCISTGVYGYPIRDATEVALKSVRELLDKEDGKKVVSR